MTRHIPSIPRVYEEAAVSEDLGCIRQCPPQLGDFHRDFSSLQILQQQPQSIRRKLPHVYAGMACIKNYTAQ